VFGCSGYATDDILIEAIDRAVRDGCDVINLSLATGSGYADTVRG
jgi:subtilisin family serine protease